jgi:hypothetical protein
MRVAWNIDDDSERETAEVDVEAWHDAITAEINNCEQWHEANGTLHEEIG